MCGGFDDAARAAAQPQGFPVPPLDFDFLFRNPATPESNEMPEEEMVEEVFEDGKFDLIFILFRSYEQPIRISIFFSFLFEVFFKYKKNFAYVLLFFSLISDGLGSVK